MPKETDRERIRREYTELQDKEREERNRSIIGQGITQRGKKIIYVPQMVRVCTKCGSDKFENYKGFPKKYKCRKCGQWHCPDLD